MDPQKRQHHRSCGMSSSPQVRHVHRNSGLSLAGPSGVCLPRVGARISGRGLAVSQAAQIACVAGLFKVHCRHDQWTVASALAWGSRAMAGTGCGVEFDYIRGRGVSHAAHIEVRSLFNKVQVEHSHSAVGEDNGAERRPSLKTVPDTAVSVAAESSARLSARPTAS